ncbi:hypothetical protein IHQ68_03330 [Chelatococcus sambhunathii]|uniref:Uncharacterized protein n=1 Tax=Chelatococcus sambhunathii TaxID=363953 RepID=A0ABU1DC15_9HYPH|nr:hypothetical protein [Chelatococcus sambhunathii]MDR4305654.1 hypothetical protein [Chelatococcus sambhunathii]
MASTTTGARPHPASFLAFGCSALAYDEALRELVGADPEPGDVERVRKQWIADVERQDCAERYSARVALSTFLGIGNRNPIDTAAVLNRGVPASEAHAVFAPEDVLPAIEQAVGGIIEPTSCSRLLGKEVLLRTFGQWNVWQGAALEILWREASTRPDFRRRKLSSSARARELIRETSLLPLPDGIPENAVLEAHVELLRLVQRILAKPPTRAAA